MTQDAEITDLLRRWTGGDDGAGEELAPLVYDELYRRAAQIFRRESPGHTLQPTALVNEAYAKLIEAKVDWQDRAHFYALSARMMRRLLVNHANARRAERRGRGAIHVTLESQEIPSDVAPPDVMILADTLNSLASIDPEKHRLIEMQYFGGMTIEEMAFVTGKSIATVGRDLRFARAWMKKEIQNAS
ncbi:sigma-70 family RNA polymerase sigma factor [Erythrobacter sp. NFXS35]|uniref:ECF-type sigma factor n=1 Tax=Erythrobacter sp. NFXS35 TaxID=2818436 RepID=UPI0032DE4148